VHPRTAFLWVTVVASVVVSACAPTAQPVSQSAREGQVASCRQHYAALDARVAEAGVGDGLFTPIAGYPYLRIDRFLADDAIKRQAGGDGFDAWVARLRLMDLDARRFELWNLPQQGDSAAGRVSRQTLEDCSALLIEADLPDGAAREQLLAAAQVFDAYSVAKRVFGLYPFTSLAFNSGVKDLHDSMGAEFSRPLDALAVEGRLTRYHPPPASTALTTHGAAALVVAAPDDALGIPVLSPADLPALFDAFAPVYEIDVLGDDDRIGSVLWADAERPSVDVARPAVYRRLSYTRFEGRTLVQLNYSVWFPSRPADGDFDLLSGWLDGITFRVTLGPDGRALIYDSMHNCGCYHLFLPTRRLSSKPPSGAHEEAPLIPQQIALQHGRVVLRIAHSTHYLQRLYFESGVPGGSQYVLVDDDSLRSLPLVNGQRRSLFAPDGLVVGSERGERWLFWPMGIAEPGAMRQWGHHAIAFVGIRHFDDPDLIERYFRSVE